MVHVIVQPPKQQPVVSSHELENVTFAKKLNIAAQSIQSIWRRSNNNKNLQQQQLYDRRADILLPVLIIPGVASSGLIIEESGLDDPASSCKKYQRTRVWMNATMLAAGRVQQGHVLNADEIKQAVKEGNVAKLFLSNDVKETFQKGGKAIRDALLHADEEDDEEDHQQQKKTDDNATTTTADAAAAVSAANDAAFAEVEQACQVRSAWLHHMSLSANMIDERPGNKVRPYMGLEGIEYLSDDAATRIASWVHAPVTKYLVEEVGYQKGLNLDGAPYEYVIITVIKIVIVTSHHSFGRMFNSLTIKKIVRHLLNNHSWRLPPRATEERDGYLTNTMRRIEKMYTDNGDLPIVLLCHSMGCKMGHYFLNFAKQQRGQQWLDKYVHTYMPVGAPHGGVSLAVRAGVTGKGLSDEVDMMMAGDDEGLTLYRSWGSGAWLMPRYLPTDVVPCAIVRKEGELAVAVKEENLQVGPLFANRHKLPKELRLAVEFRGLVARTEFHPLVIEKDDNGKNVDPPRATVAFDETFYITVPFLGNYDSLGEVQFFLEEPAGRLNQNYSAFRLKLKQSTSWAPIRAAKKKASKAMRAVAKALGASLRVAMSREPCRLMASQFPKEEDDANQMEVEITMCECRDTKKSRNVVPNESNDDGVDDDDGDSHKAEETDVEPILHRELGKLHFLLRYRPHPTHSCGEAVATPIGAVTPGKTPTVPIESRNNKGTADLYPAMYETWTGYDLLYHDGFCNPIWKLLKDYYENDPLGPTKRSALDAPPVKRVRSIYGINLDTEVSAVYRHRPVVIVGDDKADSRYVVDESARFPDEQDGSVQSNYWAKHNLSDYKMNKGRIFETPQTLQNVPGRRQQRRVCGDGTVPYWNLIHCLSWKDIVPDLTIDELEKAEHRGILADKRFHALLKRYCKIKDPRANAMLQLREQSTRARMTKGGGGIQSLQATLSEIDSPSENTADESMEVDVNGNVSIS